jgi:hypothetical protein
MTRTKKPRKTLPVGVVRVLKRLHYPLEVIRLCIQWYVAYPLSPRDLEEMMAARCFEVDHSSVHRWVIKLVPLLGKAFCKHRRPVGKSGRMDETYVNVRGRWETSNLPWTRPATPSISRFGPVSKTGVRRYFSFQFHPPYRLESRTSRHAFIQRGYRNNIKTSDELTTIHE